MDQTGGDRPLAAAVLVLSAMALLGVIDNFVVVIARDVGLWQFHLTRSILALPMIVGLGWLFGQRLRPRRWGAVALRSFLVASAMVLYFGSLAFMPIAEVGAGLFTSPIFVVVLSVLFFDEAIGPVRIGAVLAGFLGIVLVLQPDAGAFSIWSLVPVGAGALYALGALATRHLCKGEATMTLLAGFFGVLGLWALVGAFVVNFVLPEGEGFILRGWATGTTVFWQLVVVQAVGSIIGIGLLTRAYQLAEASYVAVFEYALLIFAGGFAWIWWGEALGPLALAGIALVSLAGAVIAWRS